MITASRTGAGLFAATLLVAGGGTSAWAETANVGNGAYLVDAYAHACLPERFNFDGLLIHAQKLGWSDRNLHLHDQLNALMLKARDAIYAEQDDGFQFDARMAAFWRSLDEKTLYLVVTELKSDIIDLVACDIYDFGAKELIDPDLVTALLNHPIASRSDGENPDYQLPVSEVVNVIWGPPSAYPRMFDTHLTFIPAGSPYAEDLGFTGLMLTSQTSLPQTASN